MKEKYKKVIWMVIVVLMILTQVNEVSAMSYKRYTNSRFCYSIKYPAFFKQSQPLPTDGDGITMSGKGAKLLMYGELQVIYFDGYQMKKTLKSYGEKMKNVKVSKKSLYYETEKGKKITYHYGFFRKNDIVNIELSCKKSKKVYFKKIFKKLKSSVNEN